MAVAISDVLLDCSDRLLEAEPDEHLVGLAQSGHDAAFAAIVRRYEPELLARARRLGADGRAEDAVQQVFLNAFAALRSGSDVRHLRGWLHQILRNAVIRGQVPIDAPLEAASAYGEPLEEIVERRAQAHATLVELSALPDRQRDALLGTAVMGFPRSLVAQRMGLSEGAVRQLVHRARLRLRQAATALVPFPLARLFGAAGAGSGATSSEAVLGAGAAASGGMAIKVGTLLASGVVATGLAVTHGLRGNHHHTSGGSRTQHQLSQSPAHARGAQRLTEAPAIRPVVVSAATGPIAGVMVVHDRTTRRGLPSSTLPGRLHETGATGLGPGRGRDNGRGHASGVRGEQSTSPAGRGGDTGARGSSGTNDGGHGSAGTNDGPGHSGGRDGGPSRSGGNQGERTGSGSTSGSGHSGSGSDANSSSPSGGSGRDGSGSGHDGGGSTDGNAQRSSVSDPSAVRTVTGDTATSRASGSDGSTSGSGGSPSGSGGSTGSSGASSGSSGTSNGPSSTSAPSASDGSGGSGSDGSPKSFATSRDVSGSVDSSSS